MINDLPFSSLQFSSEYCDHASHTTLSLCTVDGIADFLRKTKDPFHWLKVLHVVPGGRGNSSWPGSHWYFVPWRCSPKQVPLRKRFSFPFLRPHRLMLLRARLLSLAPTPSFAGPWRGEFFSQVKLKPDVIESSPAPPRRRGRHFAPRCCAQPAAPRRLHAAPRPGEAERAAEGESPPRRLHTAPRPGDAAEAGRAGPTRGRPARAASSSAGVEVPPLPPYLTSCGVLSSCPCCSPFSPPPVVAFRPGGGRL